jgi:hypothetical protein
MYIFLAYQKSCYIFGSSNKTKVQQTTHNTMNTKELSISLNSDERAVLDAVVSAHKWAGGEFTYFDEVCRELPNLTIHQVKGYLSQLVQKGLIFISRDEFQQINLKREVIQFYPNIEDTHEII